jgi:hypothetical protein
MNVGFGLIIGMEIIGDGNTNGNGWYEMATGINLVWK